MNVTKKDIEKRQIELTIELSVAELKPYIGRAVTRISKEVKIDGFRPGKVPFNVLKKKVGEQEIYQEAAQDAVQKSFVNAVINEKLNTVGRPQINVQKIAPGNPFVYTATVALMPEVTVGDYSTMTTKKNEVTVTDEDVTGTLDELRKMRGKEKLVLRKAQKGDKAEINFTISKNNVPIEGGSATKYPLTLGEGKFIPGFEEAVIGMDAGEEKTFKLTFPSDYFKRHLADVEHDVKVKVESVFQIDIPDADDEFAKSIGEYKNIQELRDALKENIRRDKDIKATEESDSKLLLELVGKSTFGEFPEVLVAGEIDKMLQEMKADFASKGMQFSDYLAQIQKTEEDLKKEFRTPADERLKTALVIRAVIEKENIILDEKELDEEMVKIKKLYEHSEEALKKIDTNDYRGYLGNVILNRKVVEKLRAAVSPSS